MTVCLVAQCDRTPRTFGWCAMHYRRWQRHGSALTVFPKGPKPGTERPNTKRATLKPTIKDLYWAAGFVEGEGSFSSDSRVSVVQVNPEPVERLLALFGGALKQYQKRQGAIHKTPPSPVWTWYASGGRARGIMMTLYPLLSKKRQNQICSALLLKGAA